MQVTMLGRTGLTVSRLCLGAANFGRQCDESVARQIFEAAAEAGITFIDTADAYTGSEEILGRILRGQRDQFILTTKGGGRVGGQPWESGASRKHLLDSVDGSLRRLQCEYVDIYLAHLYDARTPLDETLEALDAIRTSGKARYVGCSNYAAYQLARALGRSEVRGLARFAVVQPRYNLLSRQIERELLPLCAEEGLGVTVYNPLAGGLLTGKHARDAPPIDDTRFGQRAGSRGDMYRDRYWHKEQFDAVDALRPLAQDAGMSLTTLAMAWILSKPEITAAIIGPSRPEQLNDVIAAIDAELPAAIADKVDTLTKTWRNDSA